ncbi:MAG: DUF4398 domain-containing protein [Candidatus Competibacteraceae bacterium]|nr:DUF4398 domain-containing protein [Candidatus Competibacteraceae bacterium]
MSKLRIILLGALGGLLLAGCATAPVQEMSDARQAIRSAEEAGAAHYAQPQLKRARGLLDRAQRNLESGAYYQARRLALDAREEAIRAREQASGLTGGQQP